MINIYKPYLPKKVLKYVNDAVESGWISSQGKYLPLCEGLIKELFHYRYVLLVNNGTSATHLVSKCLKYRYPDKHYIVVPNNVYVASWNAFLYDKDWKLICVDVDLDTWNINTDDLIIDSDGIVLIVHNLGNIFNVPKFKREWTSSIIVEDNCEGFMGKYETEYSGSACLCSSVSFFANKNITSGEGGLFCTDSEDLYEYAKLIHGQGQSKERYIHNVLGNNFRMTNIQAALLYGQLLIIDEIKERKQEIFDYYRKKLSGIENVRFQKVDENCSHSNWMFGLRILGNYDYDYVKHSFDKNGVETRPLFYPIHYHKHLETIECLDNSNSETLSRECFMIPSYPELTKKDQDYIIKIIEEYCRML